MVISGVPVLTAAGAADILRRHERTVSPLNSLEPLVAKVSNGVGGARLTD